MIKILANDGIDAAGKKIFEAAGFSVTTDKVAQENLGEALKNFDAVLVRSATQVRKEHIDAAPNLKLIGRATYLIQSHANDILRHPAWLKKYGSREQISYGEANAVLFDAIDFLKGRRDAAGQTAEVALSIIRILESLRQNKGVTKEEALEVVQKVGLKRYLTSIRKDGL